MKICIFYAFIKNSFKDFSVIMDDTLEIKYKLPFISIRLGVLERNIS